MLEFVKLHISKYKSNRKLVYYQEIYNSLQRNLISGKTPNKNIRSEKIEKLTESTNKKKMIEVKECLWSFINLSNDNITFSSGEWDTVLIKFMFLWPTSFEFISE